MERVAIYGALISRLYSDIGGAEIGLIGFDVRSRAGREYLSLTRGQFELPEKENILSESDSVRLSVRSNKHAYSGYFVTVDTELGEVSSIVDPVEKICFLVVDGELYFIDASQMTNGNSLLFYADFVEILIASLN